MTDNALCPWHVLGLSLFIPTWENCCLSAWSRTFTTSNGLMTMASVRPEHSPAMVSTLVNIEMQDANFTNSVELQNSKITVEPVLKDHPIGHKYVVCRDRWSLVTGSVTLNCRSFWRRYMVCQDRWSLMAVVSQDRFYCIFNTWKSYKKSGNTLYCKIP